MKTQSEIRESFWDAFPQFRRLPGIRNGRTPSGRLRYRPARQNDYPATVRCAFVDYVDALARNGEISDSLAQSVTL